MGCFDFDFTQYIHSSPAWPTISIKNAFQYAICKIAVILFGPECVNYHHGIKPGGPFY